MTALDRKLILVLIIGSVALLGVRFLLTTEGDVTVRVELAGKVIREIHPAAVEGKVVPIPIPGGVAELKFKNGAVRLLEMPDWLCPRKICSHSGWISKPGETLICVPNRLVIRVVKGGRSQIDAITR